MIIGMTGKTLRNNVYLPLSRASFVRRSLHRGSLRFLDKSRMASVLHTAGRYTTPRAASAYPTRWHLTFGYLQCFLLGMRYLLSNQLSSYLPVQCHRRCTRYLTIPASYAAVTAGKHVTSGDAHSMLIGESCFRLVKAFSYQANDRVRADGWKYPIFSSDRVRERKSVFLAHASTLSSPADLSEFIDRLSSLPVLKRATHCMYAYRVIPDPEISSNKILGQHDGRERGSGERLCRLLDVLECQNVVVVVSRWYGGVPLGSDRWKIISSVAKEALNKGGFVEPKCTDAALSTKVKTKKRR